MTIEDRKDRLIHIILNCGDDEALLSQLENLVISSSEWGKLITEDPMDQHVSTGDTTGQVREPTANYRSDDLTEEQLAGLLKAKESVRAGRVVSHDEVMGDLYKKFGLEWEGEV